MKQRFSCEPVPTMNEHMDITEGHLSLAHTPFDSLNIMCKMHYSLHSVLQECNIHIITY